MRRFTKSLAAVAIATGATFASFAAPGTAQADARQDGLVNVYLEDVLTGNQVALLNNVAVPIAADVCGLDVDVLASDLLSNDRVACVAKNTSLQKAYIANI